MSFFPIKLKCSELSGSCIERQKDTMGFMPHCFEYSFTNEISITPRIKPFITELYLELPTNKDNPLKVPCVDCPRNEHLWLNPYTQRTEYKDLVGDVLDKPLSGNFIFQMRLENRVMVPSYGYIVLEFEHGKKCKEKANIVLEKEIKNETIR